MGDLHKELTDRLIDFINKQKLFFIATAPEEGRISLSPKGVDTLRVIDDKTIAYLDLTGSGAETAAHLHQNGRVTVMCSSFEGPPMVLRIYGKGRAVRKRDADWDDHYKHFDPLPGARHVIIIEIDSVQTSCGYGVPLFEYKGERPELLKWLEKKGDEGAKEYWKERTGTTIDGIPTKILED